MTTSIEELLEAKPAGQAPAEPQASPQTGEAEQPATLQPQTETAAPEANTGQQPGANTNGVPPTPENPAEEVAKVRAFQKKAEDETRKRQELEKQIGELRQQAAEMQNYLRQSQGQQPAQQQPEFLDPEAVQYLQQIRDRDRAEIGQELYRTRVEQSQFVMRQQKPDYDEVEAVFADEASRNPALWQELAHHSMPAAFAYEHGRKVKAMREIGEDPVAYREKMKQEILAELQTSQPAPQIRPQAQAAPAPPPSLAGVPSATPRMAQAYQGPTPLEDLLSMPMRRR